MSFSDVFHDYIQDIPMVVGRKFFPTPNILIDEVFIPNGLGFPEFQYDFQAENRARNTFDMHNEEIKKKKNEIPIVENDPPIPSTSICTVRSNSGLSQDVLVPCPVSSPAVVKISEPIIPKNNFFDFEAQNSVFDDVEISALDDKKALQEILMSSSSHSSVNSPLLKQNNSVNNNIDNKVDTPIPATKSTKEEELRKRLINKGFRSDIIDICLNKLPKSRFIHIEYYMKACRTMEKTGRATIEDGLEFLIKCDLNDKQKVLQFSETCSSILLMGFPKETVFETVISEHGDYNKSLNRLTKKE